MVAETAVPGKNQRRSTINHPQQIVAHYELSVAGHLSHAKGYDILDMDELCNGLLLYHSEVRNKVLYLHSEDQSGGFYFDLEFWCFNGTFSSISAISWRPVLVVEEAGVPGQNH